MSSLHPRGRCAAQECVRGSVLGLVGLGPVATSSSCPGDVCDACGGLGALGLDSGAARDRGLYREEKEKRSGFSR